MTDLIGRLKRASRRPPREIAQRVVEIGRARARRPWSRVYPHLVTERRLLEATRAASLDQWWRAQQARPFFVSPRSRVEWTRAFRTRYPQLVDAIAGAADRIVRHEFDLLGSGCTALGAVLPWHTDFKTGREWPIEYASDLDYLELDRSSDVKVPWELSRCQHFTTLGQAYWLTGDERYAREFVDQTLDWIERNPWSYGVNWACAMDVALRAVSWIWGFYFFAESNACASQRFRSAFLRSLYMHGDYVSAHLEKGDVNGNHYLCDGVGLVFLGTFFGEMSKGRQWLRIGRDIVDAEIFNQTSVDGVDFEKSTAYHRLVLEAFLTSSLLLELHGDDRSAAWKDRACRMIEFVEAYTKPDGTIPLVGDADDGRIQKLGLQDVNDHRYLLSIGAALFGRGDFKRTGGAFHDEAFWLLGPDGARAFDAVDVIDSPLASRAFPAGGFYVLRTDRAHVFIDCGEVGMHGRGGHGHNDITSLEVWLDGMNVVTDCGAYVYTASREWRNRFRSTAFHNVVQVDGEELNRLIAPDLLWSLRDDARPQQVSCQWDDRADCFRGSHGGYARLNPPVTTITREVELIKDGPDVVIHDSVEGADSHDLVWRFHLDPKLTVDLVGEDVRLSGSTREAWLQRLDPIAGSTVTIEEGWVSPSYGVRLKTRVIVIGIRARLPVTTSYRLGLVRLSPTELQEIAAGRHRCVNC